MEEKTHTPEQTPSSASEDNLTLKTEGQSCPEAETKSVEATDVQSESTLTEKGVSEEKNSSEAQVKKDTQEEEKTSYNTEKAQGEEEGSVSSSSGKLNAEMLRHQQLAERSKSHASYLSDHNSYWFLLRDLRRANSLEHGYELLEKKGMRVFTPLEWRIKKTPLKKVRVLVPVMPDLLFVFGTYKQVAEQVNLIPRIQFRYLKGKGFMEPTTIPTEEMEYFIKAVSNSDEPKFYLPGEISESDIGRQVMIIGGPLNGYTGRLLKWKGSKKKALIIEIKNYLVGTVTLEPELIQYMD